MWRECKKLPEFLATSEMRKTGCLHISLLTGVEHGGEGRVLPSEWSERAFGKGARSLWGTCLLVASHGSRVEHTVMKIVRAQTIFPIFLSFGTFQNPYKVYVMNIVMLLQEGSSC